VEVEGPEEADRIRRHLRDAGIPTGRVMFHFAEVPDFSDFDLGWGTARTTTIVQNCLPRRLGRNRLLDRLRYWLGR
jgi:hypothetical protein